MAYLVTSWSRARDVRSVTTGLEWRGDRTNSDRSNRSSLSMSKTGNRMDVQAKTYELAFRSIVNGTSLPN